MRSSLHAGIQGPSYLLPSCSAIHQGLVSCWQKREDREHRGSGSFRDQAWKWHTSLPPISTGQNTATWASASHKKSGKCHPAMCSGKKWKQDLVKHGSPSHPPNTFKGVTKMSTVQFSCSFVSDSLWPHGLQHTRPPCPSPTPGVYSNSCPLSRWYHPTISSSAVPFSSLLQSFLGLFKWVSSLHQVAKVLEFQLQRQSFQWIIRTNSL